MATTNQTVTSAAYTLVTSETNFLVQVAGNDHVYFAFGSEAPANSVVGHVLNRNEGLTRSGLTGSLYARASQGSVLIVVSAG